MSGSSPTQQSIEIAGIKEGIVILRSGSYRMILSVSSINFALKSEQEQTSLIMQYQGFLNSLHFPIQIVMQSKKLDLTPYLKKIETISEQQKNELIRIQTLDYIDFVSKLINVANIMKKSFYVIVPYEPITLKKGSLLDIFFKKSSSPSVKIPEMEFKHHKDELAQRANVIASGLGSMGLQCVQLNTEELIELFYKIYNPDVASKQRIDEIGKLTSAVVELKQKETEQTGSTNISSASEETLINNAAIVEQKQKLESNEKFEENLEKDAQEPNGTPAPQSSAPPSTQPAQTAQAQTALPVANPAQTGNPAAPATTIPGSPAPTQNTADNTAPDPTIIDKGNFGD